MPITEDFPTGATTNPYGTTKVFTERILTDCCTADPELNVALLRYFNPIGALPSGLLVRSTTWTTRTSSRSSPRATSVR